MEQSSDSKSHINDSIIILNYVQDGQVTLKVMLSSPYLTESISKVVQWASNYSQVEAIVDLWYTCERKVQIYFMYVYTHV